MRILQSQSSLQVQLQLTLDGNFRRDPEPEPPAEAPKFLTHRNCEKREMIIAVLSCYILG